MPRLIIDIPDDHGRYHRRDEGESPIRALRWRYCLLGGALITVVLLLMVRWAPRIAELAWTHWPWTVLLPGALIVAWLADFDSFGARAVPIAAGVVAAAHIDGQVNIWRLASLDVLGQPLWVWLAAGCITIGLSWPLRIADPEDIPSLVLATAIGLVALGLFGYFGYRGLTQPEVLDWLTGVAEGARENWPPVAFGISLGVTTLWLWSASALGWSESDDDDDDWLESVYDDYEDSIAAVGDSDVPGRGAWLRNAMAALQRAGISLLDVLLVVVTIGLFALTMLYYLPDQLISTSGLTEVEASKARTEERRTMLALLAAVGAGLGLVYTHLRHQLDREAAVSSRFSEGVRQLATTDVSTRQGGVYALGQVARQSRRDADKAIRVLSAFTVESARHRAAVPGDAVVPVPTVTMAGLETLSETWSGNQPPDLRNLDLSATSLRIFRFRPRTDLSSADFSHAEFEQVGLQRAELSNATFQSATLQRVDAKAATMHGANFREARLVDVDFTAADLEDADLRHSHIEDSRLEGAILHKADLRGATVRHLDLSDVDLNSSDLRGCDMSESWCREDTKIQNAKSDEKTRWPRGFNTKNLSADDLHETSPS